jgi:flagellar protein FliO/FliZ
MMLAYILKLIILIPLVGGLAFGALWLWRKVQPGMAFSQREKAVKLVDAIPLGTSGRLAVVDFADKRLLVAVTRTGIQLIAETPAVATFEVPADA